MDAFVEGMRGAPFALQPFSSLAAKEWPDDNVLAAARLLAENGLASRAALGPGERERAEALVARGGGALLLAPPAGAAATARLGARAALFIGADTGPSRGGGRHAHRGALRPHRSRPIRPHRLPRRGAEGAASVQSRERPPRRAHRR